MHHVTFETPNRKDRNAITYWFLLPGGRSPVHICIHSHIIHFIYLVSSYIYICICLYIVSYGYCYSCWLGQLASPIGRIPRVSSARPPAEHRHYILLLCGFNRQSAIGKGSGGRWAPGPRWPPQLPWACCRPQRGPGREPLGPQGPPPPGWGLPGT